MSYVAHVRYENLVDLRDRARDEVGKVVVGHGRRRRPAARRGARAGPRPDRRAPGSAKTLLGRAMAHVLGAKFKRIQFTPDTAPDEITGHNRPRWASRSSCPASSSRMCFSPTRSTAPRRARRRRCSRRCRSAPSRSRANAPAARPVPRDRDPEPVRARGHLPAARVAARPLPVQDHPRLRDAESEIEMLGSRTPA